jgi:hypothetical protein
MTTTADETAKVTTLAAWKKNKTHTVTLPSSTIVEIQIPDLPSLIKAGKVPNQLLDIALGATEKKKVTKEDIEQQADFYNILASLTVTTPVVTQDDFSSGALPFEDKEMLVEIATRQRDLDAVGKHIAGLDKVASFREYRNISSQYAALEDS